MRHLPGANARAAGLETGYIRFRSDEPRPWLRFRRLVGANCAPASNSAALLGRCRLARDR
jgi:hypothetical protein